MDDDPTFLAGLVLSTSEHLRTAVSRERRGRGQTVMDLVLAVCDRIDAETQAIEGRLPLVDKNEAPPTQRELLRLRNEQHVLHELLAHYQGDPGRSDLPVGLLHLIDELVRDLLPKRADPIIHLNVQPMYSTLAVLEAIPSLLRNYHPPEPHPVAFNLPSLDPANALFAPILAHEVGHTAWRQGLSSQLDSVADLTAAGARLKEGASQGRADPATVARIFDSWRQELMCDALAAVLTGPSFLFASAVFLPAVNAGASETHPCPRDRLAFSLALLERLGWTRVLERLTPAVLKWCSDSARSPKPGGGPVEEALRDTCAIIEPAIQDVAVNTAKNALTPVAFEGAEAQLIESLTLGVPPVVVEGGYTSPWQMVAGAWLNEVRRRGDVPAMLAPIAQDAGLNRFLVKSIELAGIGRLWGEN